MLRSIASGSNVSINHVQMCNNWETNDITPLLLLAWYSLLFWRMPLVQSNFQGSLKAHQLSVKNSFSSPGPQREGGRMQQLGLGQHHGQSHHVGSTEGSASCHPAASCNLHLTSLGPPPIPHIFHLSFSLSSSWMLGFPGCSQFKFWSFVPPKSWFSHFIHAS